MARKVTCFCQRRWAEHEAITTVVVVAIATTAIALLIESHHTTIADTRVIVVVVFANTNTVTVTEMTRRRHQANIRLPAIKGVRSHVAKQGIRENRCGWCRACELFVQKGIGFVVCRREKITWQRREGVVRSTGRGGRCVGRISTQFFGKKTHGAFSDQ